MADLEHLTLEVKYSADKKTIQSIFANRKRVLSGIPEDQLPAFLEQLRGEGWVFVHEHSMDKVYRIYYFTRRKQR